MTLLHSLVRYYERLEKTGVVAPPGCSSEKISFVLVLTRNGVVADIHDLRDHSGKKPQPKPLMVPQATKRTSGVASNFLWDKTAYVFGASARSTRRGEEHAAFRARHEELLAGTDDEGLGAILTFLQSWDPARYASLRYADEMLDQNVAFRLDGELGLLHERDAARHVWIEHLEGAASETGVCLVTGEEGPIARLHPAIKGVPGAQTSGASIVSFNLDAFTSYGKEQGANAPVSARAAHAYGTALNTLLSLKEGIDPNGGPRWRNRVRIGDATTVFWAEAEGGPEAAEAAEIVVFWTLAPPTDEEESAKIQSVLHKIEVGRPAEEIDELGGRLDSKTRFYVLGLSPNAARLSVRFYQESTLGDMIRRAHEHFSDLSIEPHSWNVPPAPWRLLRETAAQRGAENVSPALAGEFARAVLIGGRYPRALLALTLTRIAQTARSTIYAPRSAKPASRAHTARISNRTAPILRRTCPWPSTATNSIPAIGSGGSSPSWSVRNSPRSAT
jgi:CRISPR-associated protein Csd1